MNEKQNIITKVESASDWLNSLVVIEKPNKSLRLLLDPQELNNCIKRDFFEIPCIEEMFTVFRNCLFHVTAKLASKRYFSVFDFKNGFYQVKLDEPSSNLITFATPFGCYKFLRLPFGLNMAPKYFQHVNPKNFEGIENVVIYFDDLLIVTDTLEQQ